jgi:nitrite reductase (NO-forming) / hydroxylamine reductase
MDNAKSTVSALSLAVGLAMGAGMTGGSVAHAGEPQLSPEAWERSKQIYFSRCAGCHGTLRTGATGPDLLPATSQDLGQRRLERIIGLGTEGGMNNFDGILSQEEISHISTYIQMEPPVPPEMSLEEMKETWKVFVEPKDYPDKPMHGRNWENFFVTILRDVGQVAVIDGDTKEVISKVDTGYAVHVMKPSKSGRFWGIQGRDGKLSKLDLWMDPPQVVAEVHIAYDARDLDISKYGEYADKYIVGGGYWPPHFVIADFETMEPLKVVSTRTYNTKGEFMNEARVAAIYDTPKAPTWLINVKESGQVWQVDYSDIANLRIDKIDSAEFLHDGFFDASGRYFMIAANMSNKMVFTDTIERKLVSILETGIRPHPGPGANWIDPECGPVAGTVHLGEGKLTVWGTDPVNHPEQAWNICFTAETDGGGLFLRSHPDSPHVWMDQTIHPEPDVNQVVYVLNKQTRELTPIRVTDMAPEFDAVATHIEYNTGGEEAWVSVWVRGAGKAEYGEIVVYDDKTLQEKARITGVETPTGKFHVHNRVNKVG